MRSLIIRFEDCEGPGIYEKVLREKGYSITYHDAFHADLELIPTSHQMFDFFLFLGGSASVYATEKKEYFQPYKNLINDSLNLNKKVMGVCLGSQLLAEVLGATVNRGAKGGEFGFGKIHISNINHDIFKGIQDPELDVFHFHNDVFTSPKDSSILGNSTLYENQIFIFKNIALGILPHFELTIEMYYVWKSRFHDIRSKVNENNDMLTLFNKVNLTGETILKNFLNLS